MKILIVNSFYYPEVIGGGEYSVKKLAEGLVKRNHDVLVITAGNQNKTEYIENVRVKRLKLKSFYHSYGKVKKNLFTMIGHRILDIYNPFNATIFSKEIEQFKPDIIHTNGIYEISSSIWFVAKKKGVPIIHTARDYNLVNLRSTLEKDSGILNIEDLFFGVPYRFINRRLLQAIDYVTTPSQAMMNNMREMNFFVNKNNSVVYNAIDFDSIMVSKQINKKKKSSREEVTFVYLGGLYPHKGITVLLEAFAKIESTKARLIFAGKGVEEDAVMEACIKDTRINYVGFLDETKLAKILEQCDVLVCPSVWEEPFGRVILDAYKNGLPVIASRVGGLPEIVNNNVTGILVEPGDSNELSEAINKFLENDAFYQQCLNQLLDELRRFSLDRQLDVFTNIYNDLLRRKA
ncbi:glycosyltransferase family 4 protein [Enterococcus sp. DIV0187]|uniref:glycosyltransferase family 4 protein n=1 Tax=Enterococcus sp. DIV0187 TaxID=2774644 RepID=UPI003F2942E7